MEQRSGDDGGREWEKIKGGKEKEEKKDEKSEKIVERQTLTLMLTVASSLSLSLPPHL